MSPSLPVFPRSPATSALERNREWARFVEILHRGYLGPLHGDGRPEIRIQQRANAFSLNDHGESDSRGAPPIVASHRSTWFTSPKINSRTPSHLPCKREIIRLT
jgi:hypothetical protein